MEKSDRPVLAQALRDQKTRAMTPRERRRWLKRDDAAQAKKATRSWRRQQRSLEVKRDHLLAIADAADGTIEATPACQRNAVREMERLDAVPAVQAELAAKKAERRAQHEANRRRNLETMA